jgi:ubiquinone/menaquinone biosynthesis C-methylase UbiE
VGLRHGNGQAAVALAARFTGVVATDASAEQVGNAFLHPRVEYRVAPAEASGLEAESVDLVTAAQAVHWFDVPAFFAEARRVPPAARLVSGVGVWGLRPLA